MSPIANLSSGAALGFQAGTGQGKNEGGLGGFVKGILKKEEALRATKAKISQEIQVTGAKETIKAKFAGPKKFQPSSFEEAVSFEQEKGKAKDKFSSKFRSELTNAQKILSEGSINPNTKKPYTKDELADILNFNFPENSAAVNRILKKKKGFEEAVGDVIGRFITGQSNK